MSPATKEIFVIEGGAYSDYRVAGVFSSRKNAEAVLRAIRRGNRDLSVAAWPLDPNVADVSKGYSCWRVLMLRNGDVEEAELQGYPSIGENFAQIWRRSEAPAYKETGEPDVLQWEGWAKDRKHAVKIANEVRTRMVAEGKWKVSRKARTA